MEYSAPDDNLPIVRLRTNDGKTVRLTRQRDSDKLVVVKGDSNDELQRFHDGADHKRLPDCLRSPPSRLAGKIKPSPRINLPKIDPRSQPVVVVVAWLKRIAFKEAFADLAITPVIAEDEC